MKILLIGGAQNVGKSEAIFRIANLLIGKGFIIIAGCLPTNFDDFKVSLKGFDKNGKEVSVILNSATDTIDIINNLKNFMMKTEIMTS